MSDIVCRHVYVLWLWLDNLLKEAESEPLMTRKGSESLQKTMTTMQLEVPLLTLASEFFELTKNQSCSDIYTQSLGMTER